MTTTSSFILVDIVRLEGPAVYLGNDYFGLHPRRLDLRSPSSTLETNSSAFSLVDAVRFEGLAIYLINVNFFDCRRSIFAASATNSGQEGLWWGHGRLAQPDGQVLPGAHERRSKGVADFGRTKIAKFYFLHFDYTEDRLATSATGKRNRLLRLHRL
jgi:hypothetical protein